MKFSRIIGSCEPGIIHRCEERLTNLLTELCSGSQVRRGGLGSDIFLYQLLAPVEHICDARALELEGVTEKTLTSHVLSEEEKLALCAAAQIRLGSGPIQTAATDGKSIYWSPSFIQRLSQLGLRFGLMHEAYHIFCAHPLRRGRRNKELWNITIDFKTNYLILQDLRNRGITDPEELFAREMSDFITLEEFTAYLTDIFHPVEKLASWSPLHLLKSLLGRDVELSCSFGYCATELPAVLQQPEAIFDFLMKKLPTCPHCGERGAWQKSAEFIELERLLPSGLNIFKDSSCGNYLHFNAFKAGRLTDEHLESQIDGSIIRNRIREAHDMINHLGGSLPGAMKAEIALSYQPIVRWQDHVSLLKKQKEADGTRNNWSSPKRRLLATGNFVPSKRGQKIKFLLAYDCSASMDSKQIAYGVSQVQNLSRGNKGVLVPFDTQPYFKHKTDLSQNKAINLKSVPMVGGGGTRLLPLLSQYLAEVGQVDIFIIVSDFYLSDIEEVKKWRPPPGMDVILLSINGNPDFRLPYGKLFPLFVN